MVLVSTALENLINDFNLVSINEQVCFDASIKIHFEDEEMLLHNKVVIVNATLINLDTIYLLNTQLSSIGFPEIFRSDRDQYYYYTGKYLKIKGTTDGKPYTVLIQPKAEQTQPS